MYGTAGALLPYLLLPAVLLAAVCDRLHPEKLSVHRFAELLAYLPALLTLPLSLTLPLPMLRLELRHYLLLSLALVLSSAVASLKGKPAAPRLLLFTLSVAAGKLYGSAEAGVLAGALLLIPFSALTLLQGLSLPRFRLHLPVLRLPRLPRITLPSPWERGTAPAEAPAEPVEEYEEEEEHRGYTFTVLVTDRREEPLAGIRVLLRCPEAGIEELRLTDPTGRCSFEALPQGRYTVVVEGEGIERQEHQRYISMDQGEVFQVALKAEELLVVVSDRATGMPVKHAMVTLHGSRKLEARTDQLGIASFRDLEGDEFQLEVQAEGYRSYTRPVSLLAENVVSVALEKEAAEEPAQEARGAQAEEGEVEDLSGISGEGALVYVPAEELESVVEAVLREHLNAGREAVLTGSLPEALAEHASSGKLLISSEPDSEAERMPAGALLVVCLEHLERLRGDAPEVVAALAEQLREEGVFFLCFSTSPRREELERAFTHVLELRGGRLRKLRQS